MALNEHLFKVVVAPEFANEPNLDLFATEAECEVNINVWGCRYDRAVALITAHLIAMSKKSNGMGGSSVTGQLRKVKVGDLERDFASGSTADKNGSYDLTTYGAEFLRIRKQVLKGPRFIGC